MTTEGSEIVKVEHAAAGAVMSLKGVVDRVNLVHQVLEKVMHKGTHYGTVPGCGDKLVLLKPGADVLAMTFRLVPQFKVERSDLDGGHREFDVTCSMFGPDGALLGQGVGSASTMEKKYRYRWEGEGKARHKIENEDIADVYNTVLKIAKKRAHIDATLTVTGAADLFTQDLIDDEPEAQRPPVAMPTEKPKAGAQAQHPPAAREPVDGQEVVVGLVDGVSEKNGTSKRGPWTRYGIKVAGEYYNTFDSKLAEVAREAKELGADITVAFVVNEKGYKDVVGIEPAVTDAPPDKPTDSDGEQLPY